MHDLKILDFLIAFAGSIHQQSYSEWNVLLMDIVYYIFNKRDLNQLFGVEESQIATPVRLGDPSRIFSQ